MEQRSRARGVVPKTYSRDRRIDCIARSRKVTDPRSGWQTMCTDPVDALGRLARPHDFEQYLVYMSPSLVSISLLPTVTPNHFCIRCRVLHVRNRPLTLSVSRRLQHAELFAGCWFSQIICQRLSNNYDVLYTILVYTLEKEMLKGTHALDFNDAK